ncbi:MAG: hypothetical protein H6658_01825 [Ardenticatenaceae bacterium]|nr:hypothetical protein [Ardenticatenaceae bacterium]
MSGLFDKLRSEIDKRKAGQEGMRPTDLLTLPPEQRRVMRLLLREVQLSYPEIVTAVSHLPASQQLTPAELDNSLTELTQAGWLIRMGQDELITYRVDLRRKSGSQVASGMWGALEKRMQARKSDRDRGK